MSQTLSPQSPNGIRPRERPVLPPFKPPMSPPSQDGSEDGLSASSQIDGLAEHGMRERTDSIGTNESYSSRSLKVHSILNNPEAPDDQESISSQDVHASRSTSNSSPASSDAPMTPGGALHHVSSSSPSPAIPNNRVKLPTTLGPNRNIVPPALGAPTGVFDARKSPFLSGAISNGETHHSESIAGMHHSIAGPISPMSSRTIQPLSHSAVQRIGGRRESDTNSQFVPSQSNSPTTSYSSFGPPGRTTPPVNWSNNHLPTQLPSISTHMPPHISMGGGESPYGAPSGPTQNGVQLMTYYTSKGMTQIPVDVQAASKEADEKRKRNAGASARFRQRRKEKEREAAQTIAKLEGDVRKMSEERDSYRIERDYYRSIVHSVHPGALPREVSPRARRGSSSRSTSESPDWQQHGERGSDDGRNQRRRLSQYHDGPASFRPGSKTSSEYSGGSGYPYVHSDRAKNAAAAGPSPVSHYGSSTPSAYETGWATQPRA